MSKLGELVDFLSFVVGRDDNGEKYVACSPSYPDVHFTAENEHDALAGLKLLLSESDLEETV